MKKSDSDTTTIDPDASSEILVQSVKKTMSDHDFEAVTDDELAEHLEAQKAEARRLEANAMREAQIEAWNAMADAMGKVVITIKRNEKTIAEGIDEVRALARASRRRDLVLVVAAVLSLLVVGYLARSIDREFKSWRASIEAQQVSLDKKQQATLDAVNALAIALGKKLEAEHEMDPAADSEAKVSALEAQRKALEAKRETAPDATAKSKVDRQIEKVDKKAKKAKAEAPPDAAFD